MSARYNFRHQADVAADISRCRADTEPLLFSDIGPTSSLYRPDVGLISLPTSGRHRAHVQTWSRPDISRHLPMSARYNFRHQTDVAADISRCRADTEPLLFSDIGPTSSLYRPDVGLISLTTSGRHRAHVQTWSRPDISHQPTFADVGPI